MGQEALAELEQQPDKLGIIIFGRPYNALTHTANLGIPRKFASRGHLVLFLDALAFTEEAPEETMYWSMGQLIMKAAKYVKRHPQLFAAYITNFSYGPDSFLLNNFREVMGDKPSLTLELDGHTADAGVEAFQSARMSLDSTGVRVVDSRAIALSPPRESDLKLGRENSTCKECLPFTLVTGSVLDYLERRTDPEER